MEMEEKIRKKLGLDDTVDVKSLVDSALSEQENIDNITEEVLKLGYHDFKGNIKVWIIPEH